MTFASMQTVDAAPVGRVFFECCGACGTPTGRTIVKGQPDVDPDVAASHPEWILNPGVRCEYCDALGEWLHHEDINPEQTGHKYGCAKAVVDNGHGLATAFYMPFDASTAQPIEIEDGEVFDVTHGAVFRFEQSPDDDNTYRPAEVLTRGVGHSQELRADALAYLEPKYTGRLDLDPEPAATPAESAQ